MLAPRNKAYAAKTQVFLGTRHATLRQREVNTRVQSICEFNKRMRNNGSISALAIVVAFLLSRLV